MGDLFIFPNEIINIILNKCTVRSFYYICTTCRELYKYTEIMKYAIFFIINYQGNIIERLA